MNLDRTQKHLGESDRGIIMMRKRMLEQAELVARGGEPKAVIRDPAENACVQLPIIGREYFVGGYSRALCQALVVCLDVSNINFAHDFFTS